MSKVRYTMIYFLSLFFMSYSYASSSPQQDLTDPIIKYGHSYYVNAPVSSNGELIAIDTLNRMIQGDEVRNVEIYSPALLVRLEMVDGSSKLYSVSADGEFKALKGVFADFHVSYISRLGEIYFAQKPGIPYTLNRKGQLEIMNSHW